MYGKSALWSVVTMSVTLTVAAGTAHATVVEKDRMKGSQVAFAFNATKSVKCADGTRKPATAAGFISGSGSISKSKGTPAMLVNGIFVEIDSYSNGCTGASIGFATGGISGGFTTPNRNLVSAALDGTTLVQDFDTGSSVSVTLAIDVDGTGPVTGSAASTRTRTVDGPGGPVTITITQSASSSRDGTVDGTVTIDGVAFAPTATATMSFSKNSDIVIER
jgi:hypothetical protein